MVYWAHCQFVVTNASSFSIINWSRIREGREGSVCGLICGFCPSICPKALDKYLFTFSTFIMECNLRKLQCYILVVFRARSLFWGIIRAALLNKTCRFIPNPPRFIIHVLLIQQCLLAASRLQGGIWHWRNYKRKKRDQHLSIVLYVYSIRMCLCQ